MDRALSVETHSIDFVPLAQGPQLGIPQMIQSRAQFGALGVMIYLLVPWSAINLTDYYLVRKGRYIIPDMYRVEGEYGAPATRAI